MVATALGGGEAGVGAAITLGCVGAGDVSVLSRRQPSITGEVDKRIVTISARGKVFRVRFVFDLILVEPFVGPLLTPLQQSSQRLQDRAKYYPC
jgi:hypothetical protein